MQDIPEQAYAPSNEKERLEKLYGYNIIDDYHKTGAFQHVVGMAAQIFNVPVAFVNFVDEKKVIAESSVGMDGVSEFDRDTTICSQAVLKAEVTVFEDAKTEPCLATNLFVHGSLGLQFYAAAPLKTPDGYNIGVVAIVDKKPRTFSKADEHILEGLATVVMDELEERKSAAAAMG
ncbi:GAF domain-containing protein [Pontibacter harenae]|uniref:GAF domain-containing protein n=1 Tax=Pontibacter harenae TaxID=2894083 RepID=UPI001E55FDFE|nr:GAF domain-containing protein [Pontibacter harenae]MCC9166350.1 GAF domain-containing protein [Pontibacter harenae]